MEEWRHLPAAILMSWYSGSQGGRALTDVLLGRVDASGRLPFSIPKDEAHLPYFDRHATSINYDRWFGQRLLDRLSEPAAYPLGFKLSYARFSLLSLSVHPSLTSDDELDVRATVFNHSTRQGRYVAQVYGRCNVSSPDFATRALLGFQTIDVPAQQSSNIRIRASTRPLRRWSESSFQLVSKRILAM